MKTLPSATSVKTLLTAGLLAVLMQLTPATVFATDSGDDFSSATVDTNKWGADVTVGNGVLSQPNEALQFTVVKGSSYDEVRHPWVLSQFPTTNNWEARITVLANVTFPKKNQVASFGIYVRNWSDPYDNISAELYASSYGTLPTHTGFYTSLYENSTFLWYIDSNEVPTSNAVVRVVFNSATKVISLYYDLTPETDGPWVLFGAWGVAGSGGSEHADWQMGDTDRFSLEVYGYGAKAIVDAGQLAGDDFETLEGIDYEIPPTTLTASFSSVKQTCQTTCSVKGKLTMLNSTASPVDPTRIRVFASTDTTYEAETDTLLSAPQTRLVKPGKSGKLKVTGTNATSLTGQYLLAVDDSGRVLNSYLVP